MTEFEAAQLKFREDPNQDTADAYEDASIGVPDEIASAALREIVEWEINVRDLSPP